MLKTTPKDIKAILETAFENSNIEKTPKVYIFEDLPDVVAIESIENCTEPIEANDIYVDRTCASAILRGSNIYAPGVLSMTSSTKTDHLVNIFVDFSGSVLKGSKDAHSNEKAFIGIGKVKMQRYQLYGPDPVKRGIAIEMMSTVSGVPPLSDTCFPNGEAMLQNLPSIICVHVLDPQPGETILDMCAAPGNKTTHLAERMLDSGQIMALDRSANKMKILKQKIKNLNLKSVHCFVFDSTKAVCSEDSVDSDKPPFRRESFDRILLDAPCSGLGNRPLLECQASEQDILSYPVLQKKLLEAAVKLLKPGGTLVYSTCSISHLENEKVVAWMLENFADALNLVPASPLLGGSGWKNVGLTDDQR